jgi:hypothetical protein
LVFGHLNISNFDHMHGYERKIKEFSWAEPVNTFVDWALPVHSHSVRLWSSRRSHLGPFFSHRDWKFLGLWSCRCHVLPCKWGDWCSIFLLCIRSWRATAQIHVSKRQSWECSTASSTPRQCRRICSHDERVLYLFEWIGVPLIRSFIRSESYATRLNSNILRWLRIIALRAILLAGTHDSVLLTLLAFYLCQWGMFLSLSLIWSDCPFSFWFWLRTDSIVKNATAWYV